MNLIVVHGNKKSNKNDLKRVTLFHPKRKGESVMRKKQFNQKQKLAIVKKAKELGVREAARIAGVHYTTVYDWRNQLEALGEEEFLAYQPSKPGRGIKQISTSQEELILKTWHDNPGFGPGQVRNQLRRQGITISIKTIRKIMQCNGYEAPGKVKKEKCQRFEANRPLELVQMDILEFFINKLKVYIILLLDDFSRFIPGFSLLEKTSVDEVIKVVQQSIDRYGKMEEILTDRGFVFYSWRGINRFEKYLENNRIDHTHASAHHPQTLGKVESCNKRVKRELINQQHFANIQEARTAVEKWVDHYNYKRTHQGIGGLLVPAERFHGQADKVLTSIGKNVDISKENGYFGTKIDRSVINLVMNSEGKLTLFLMGQPISITGGKNVE